jgi:hypothetical protein
MALRFIEELSWLLSGYQNLDFRKLADQIVTASRERHADVSTISDHISKNPNIPFLVGALPQLLDDSSIFPTNADIASFAEEVLILQVPRWQKKSKYEIIGHLVCSTYKLDDAKLSTLVSALTKLVSGDKRAKQIIEKKKDYESNWNEIIRQLSRVG